VVEIDSQLITPPLKCGLLPGAFRAHLLETGQISERPVRVDQLRECAKIFRINSLRRWQPAVPAD
jgi:branched-subunit amino acid aminotransferase/4-amino-4-deoxychorismate lyase